MAFFVIDNGSAAILNYTPKADKKVKAISKSSAIDKIENEVHDFTEQKSRPAIAAYQEKNNSHPKKVFIAQDIMQQPVMTMDIKNLTLDHAYQVLQDNHITHLPVCRDNKLVGIVCETDILKALLFDKFPSKKNWLIKKVFAATQDTSIPQLTHAMFDSHIGAMPIINDQEEVIGIITRSDILKLTSHYGPMEFWA